MLNLTAIVANNRTITGPVTATITSSTGVTVTSNLAMAYSARQGAWIGSYAIKPEDPPGEWSVTVTASNASFSGEGYTTLAVGDAVTIWTPSSWTRQFYQVGDTISVTSYIGDTSGKNVTNGAYTATFYLAKNQSTDNGLGKIEGKVELQYDRLNELWEGNFTIPSGADQTAWITVVNGTDLNGNKGSAYTWVNVGLLGLILIDKSTYVLGDKISIFAGIAYVGYNSGPQTGTFTAEIYAGSTFIAKIPLTYKFIWIQDPFPSTDYWGGWPWTGVFSISATEPAGFYTITVNGTDGKGNSGNFSTVVRVAPYTLSVQVSVPNPTVPLRNGNESWILAKVTYPDGRPMTVGTVDGFVLLNPGDDINSPTISQVTMTYNSTAGGFIAARFLKTINATTSLLFGYPTTSRIGKYLVDVEAYNALGDYGNGTASFSVMAMNHAAINITRNTDFNATNGVIGGDGNAGDSYLIAGWNVSSISITNVTSKYELLNDYVSGCAGNGITINTPDSRPTVINVYAVRNRGNGLYANDSPAGTYSGIVAGDNGKDGILVINDTLAGNGAIEYSYAFDNALNGIVYQASSQPTNSQSFVNEPSFISDVAIDNAQDGLLSQDTKNTEFWNNQVIGNRVGVEVTGQQGSWYGCSIIEATQACNNTIGIYVDGLDQNLSGNPSYAEVYGNIPMQDGVGIYAANHAVIDAEGNLPYENNIGISTVDSLAYLIGNIVQDNSVTGIQVVGRSPFTAQKPPRGYIILTFELGPGFASVVDYNFVGFSGNSTVASGSGISVSDSDSSYIVDNQVTLNQGAGIEFNNITGVNSGNPTTIALGNSVLNNTKEDIEANNVAYVRFSGQDVERADVGIILNSCSNNTIIGNNVTTNTEGVALFSSSSNIIYGNNITRNDQGMLLSSSSNNVIYHNDFINNTRQIISDESPNTWDNGYPSGGNYWSDYQTRYPNATEIDGRGIWNTSYSIDTNNTDHYPLVKPWVPYSITFDQYGVYPDFTGTLVTIDGVNYTTADLGLATFVWNQGSVHTFSFASPLIVNSSERYLWTSTVGLSTVESGSLNVTHSGTVTGNYWMQYRVTFDQAGVGSDFKGTVVSIDGTNYTMTSLPNAFWWWFGSWHNYSFVSPLTVNSTTRYVWNYTSGLSTLQNQTWFFFVAPGEMVGNYIPQDALKFDESGIGSDFNGTMLFVDGVHYNRTQLPLALYWQVGSTHTFALNSPLTVTTDAKRYAWTSATGLSTIQNGALTVVMSGSVTGDYKTQYYLAVATVPIGITTIAGQGWYDASSVVLLAAPKGPFQPFLYWDVDGVSQGTSVNPVTVQMNAPHTATAYYSAQLVGGESVPTNSDQLLAPWITTILLATIILTVASLVTNKRKRRLHFNRSNCFNFSAAH
ncbi:MAG TPA: right-handed parallel beta-helix repeat-containing protein [Candidatus Bathyarchaeia archaeon]|nr:right-handed parallel beta-helix repeat-containing protein [Candidatus Bathyarchaeia archaeon]